MLKLLPDSHCGWSNCIHLSHFMRAKSILLQHFDANTRIMTSSRYSATRLRREIDSFLY